MKKNAIKMNQMKNLKIKKEMKSNYSITLLLMISTLLRG